MEADVQAKIDEVLAFAKENPGVVLTGDLAVELLAPLNAVAQDDWVEVHRVIDEEWSPVGADHLVSHVDDERLEELRAGADLSKEEEAQWQESVWEQMLFADILYIARNRSSDGTTFWYFVTMDGHHQGAECIDGAGPFWALSAIAACIAKTVEGWYGWHPGPEAPEDAEGFFLEIERLSGKMRSEEY